MAKATGPLYFAVYEVERLYGGPEEGGWWYDSGRVIFWRAVRRSERVHVARSPGAWRSTAACVTDKAMRAFEHFAKTECGYLPVKPRGYRDRGSVIGGPDIEVRVMSALPFDYPINRPYYE